MCLFKGCTSSKDVTEVKILRKGQGDKLIRCQTEGLRRLRHLEEVKPCDLVLSSISLRDQ